MPWLLFKEVFVTSFLTTVLRLALLAALMLVLFLPRLALPQDPFAVLAYVNQTPITAYDVEARIQLLSDTDQIAETKGAEAAFRAEVLAELIDETIQIQQAEEQGVLPTQEEIEESFARLAARNDLSAQEFEAALRSRNVDPRAFKARLLPQLAWNAVLRTNGAGRLRVSDEELEERWAEIQSYAGQNELLLTEVYLQGVELQVAQSVAGRMREERNFAAIAAEFSDSPSATNRGDLGWVRQGTLGGGKDAALRDLNRGDVSEPIFSDGGYFIYAIRSMRPIGASAIRVEWDLRTLTIPLTDQGQSLEDKQRLGALEQVLRQVDSCDRFEQAAEIYGGEGSGNLGWVDPRSLPPLILNAMGQLNPRQISPLLPSAIGGAVYIVCDTRDTSQPLTKDEVRAEMVSERRDILSDELMFAYRRAAYIEYL